MSLTFLVHVTRKQVCDVQLICCFAEQVSWWWVHIRCSWSIQCFLDFCRELSDVGVGGGVNGTAQGVGCVALLRGWSGWHCVGGWGEWHSSGGVGGWPCSGWGGWHFSEGGGPAQGVYHVYILNSVSYNSMYLCYFFKAGHFVLALDIAASILVSGICGSWCDAQSILLLGVNWRNTWLIDRVFWIYTSWVHFLFSHFFRTQDSWKWFCVWLYSSNGWWKGIEHFSCPFIY